MRKRLLCPILPLPGQRVLLPENEGNHAQRVLRLRSGEEVEALDGKGHHIVGRLQMSDLGVHLEYVSLIQDDDRKRGGLAVVPVVLEMAILKGEAMEWVVEKATELGVRSLTPVVTDHTVIQIKNKGPEFFQERWQKIADQALKQCGRLQGLKVGVPLALTDLLKTRLNSTQSGRVWCDEQKAQGGSSSLAEWILKNPLSPTHEVRILIGPEGGWSQNERALLEKLSSESGQDAIPLSLGPLVLRAETAALVTMSLISSFMRART